MNDPIKIYDEIRSSYYKYIGSGLPFFREEYNKERNNLVREPGTISQPPIIEIVPKYHEKASLKEFCLVEGIDAELNDFVNCGLFSPKGNVERKLYDHQYKALKAEKNDEAAEQLFWDDEETIKAQSYYFNNLSGYSIKTIRPYKSYLDNLQKQKEGNIFTGLSNQNNNNKDEIDEDDLSWLDSI